MDAAPAFLRQSPTPTPADDPLQPWRLRARLWWLRRAAWHLGPLEELLALHPELATIVDEAAAAGLEGLTLDAAVQCLDQRLADADRAGGDTPTQRLSRALALDASGLSALLVCLLCEDEPALALLCERMHGHDGRPARAALAGDDLPASMVDALVAAGCLQAERVGGQQVLAPFPELRDALRGTLRPPWRHTPGAALPAWSELILPAELRNSIEAALDARVDRAVCWALRGGPGSGRRTLAAALARRAGLGLLDVPGAVNEQSVPAVLPALAAWLGALPLLTLSPAPGERGCLPYTPGLEGPLALRLPAHGGVEAPARQVHAIELAPPARSERRRHWCHALQRDDLPPDLPDLRLPRGRIHRLARRLGVGAALQTAAVRAELEAEGRHRLDGLAQRVCHPGAHEALALDDELQAEFDALVARCIHRETLRESLPAAFAPDTGVGVRALLKGPSGTGKTLAARHLAAALDRPLYRVDLAATVSKYIGETERNLERVFAAAESLDIVLLLDEGDALLAGRTQIGNATDRYANLETNYLLQRLERYDGVLLVTTNASDRIDAAFMRRLDLALDFALPDARTRLRLWQQHLPAGHGLDDTALERLALRCALSGAQIRNVAVHTQLLALQHGGRAGRMDLHDALQREYRRAGQACPTLELS